MSVILTIRDLVNLWPTRAALVNDMRAINPSLRVTVGQVHKWAEKGSIRAKYQHTVLIAAQRRGFPVSAELILRLHAPFQTGLDDKRGAA